MAKLEFLKGLYEEGQEKIEEARMIGELPVTGQTTKALKTLLVLTRDNSVLSKAFKGIDKAFANDLKMINRQLRGIEDSWGELFDRAEEDQEGGSGPPKDFF